MAQYKNDPHWMMARFGNCKQCNAPLAGKKAFYYPLMKKAYCETCGDPLSREFESNKQDEEFYQNQYR